MIHKINVSPQHIIVAMPPPVADFQTGSIVTIDHLNGILNQLSTHMTLNHQTRLTDEIVEWMLEQKIHYHFDSISEQLWFGCEEDAALFKLTWC